MTDTARDAAVFRDHDTGVVEEFHADGANVGGLLEGRDLLLLTTTGSKTRLQRVSPLAYFTVDGMLLVVGSFDGNDVDPGWVHNLRADPRARVDLGTHAYDVVARDLPRRERDASYPRIVALEPGFGAYEKRANRIIPLFELQQDTRQDDRRCADEQPRLGAAT
jgi:deazaflavin-dependent oxidoreductase (nitroreductase family)